MPHRSDLPAPGLPTLLLTRPEAASARFAARLTGVKPGLTVIIAPLMRIVPVDHDAAGLARATGLVFTSENAVPSAGQGAGRPAICVGPRTAAAAQAAGFDVTEGPGDAARMMPLLADLGPGWMHPHGRYVAAELPVPGVVVYDQHPLPLSDAARAVLEGDAPVILPLFSPRSARLAAAETRDAAAPLWIATISAAADAAWDAAGGKAPARRHVADHPDAEAMLCAISALAGTERAQPGAG